MGGIDRRTLLTTASAFGLSFAAGARPAFAQTDWQAGAGADWAKVMAAAKKEGKVVVAGHSALARPFSDDFKRDTGIELEFLGGNTRELTARLQREVRSNSLTMDVSLGGGSELLTLYPEGQLVPIKPQLMLPA